MDKLVLPLAAPTFRIHRFRPLVWAFKWMLLPCLSYGYMRTYKMDDIDTRHILIADKYNFGFEDFRAAMRIWDRAERVGRLEELLTKRDEFDWTGIPPLPRYDI